MSSDLLNLVPVVARYERRPIPDAENALPLWAEAVRHFRDYDHQDTIFGELIYGTDDGRPVEIPSGDDYARVNGLLEANRQAFDITPADQGVVVVIRWAHPS